MQFPGASSPLDLVSLSFQVLSHSLRTGTQAGEERVCFVGLSVFFPIVSVKNPKRSGFSYLVNTFKNAPLQRLLCQLILALCVAGIIAIGFCILLNWGWEVGRAPSDFRTRLCPTP